MTATLITLGIFELLTIVIMLAGYERMLVITARLNNHGRWITELNNRTKNRSVRIQGENYDIRARGKNIPAVEHNK